MKKDDAIIDEATGLLEGRVAEDSSSIFASDADKRKEFQTPGLGKTG